MAKSSLSFSKVFHMSRHHSSGAGGGAYSEITHVDITGFITVKDALKSSVQPQTNIP